MIILLTGGTGFVGLNIAESLLQKGFDVVIYSNTELRASVKDDWTKKQGTYEFVHGDVLDKGQLNEVFTRYNIHTVIHTAAITPSVERERNAETASIQVNCIGTLQVIEAAHRYAVKRVIHLSSIAAYGASTVTEEMLYEEATIQQPNTFYEITKYTAEKLVNRYKQLTGLEVITVRLGDVFGPWEYKTSARDAMSALFQTTQLAIQGKHAILPKEGRKPWIYSRDVSDAIVSIVNKEKLQHDIYNISSPYVWAVTEWCELLQKKFPKFTFEVAINNGRKSNITMFADNAPMHLERLHYDIGFRAKYDLNKSFSDYIDWLQQEEI